MRKGSDGGNGKKNLGKNRKKKERKKKRLMKIMATTSFASRTTTDGTPHAHANLVAVLQVSGWCMETVWRVSGWCLEGVWRMCRGIFGTGQGQTGQVKTGQFRTCEVKIDQL